MNALSAFLDEAVEHVCDRAARRERISYHVHVAQSGPSPLRVTLSIPEKDAQGRREVPLAERHVLMGPYDDDAHLERIRQTRLYGFGNGNGETTWRLRPAVADAGYLLLHNDEVRTAELWRITSSGPRVLSGANPVVAEGLGAAEPETVYFVYEVEPDTHFEGWEWDVTELVRERPESSLPFALTLERVLAAGHPRA